MRSCDCAQDATWRWQLRAPGAVRAAHAASHCGVSGRLPWSQKEYFSREEFDADLKRIVAFYRDRGFPDARVTSFDVRLSDDQKSRIRALTDDSFASILRLTEATGLNNKEIEAAIEHPRARLRHLGSVKGDYYLRQNGNS